MKTHVIYVVVKGKFVTPLHRDKVRVGDLIFVPAGIEHEFDNFLEPFVAWVIFRGPKQYNYHDAIFIPGRH